MDGFQVAKAIINKGYSDLAPIMMLSSNKNHVLLKEEIIDKVRLPSYVGSLIPYPPLGNALERILSGQI